MVGLKLNQNDSGRYLGQRVSDSSVTSRTNGDLGGQRKVRWFGCWPSFQDQGAVRNHANGVGTAAIRESMRHFTDALASGNCFGARRSASMPVEASTSLRAGSTREVIPAERVVETSDREDRAPTGGVETVLRKLGLVICSSRRKNSDAEDAATPSAKPPAGGPQGKPRSADKSYSAASRLLTGAGESSTCGHHTQATGDAESVTISASFPGGSKRCGGVLDAAKGLHDDYFLYPHFMRPHKIKGVKSGVFSSKISSVPKRPIAGASDYPLGYEIDSYALLLPMVNHSVPGGPWSEFDNRYLYANLDDRKSERALYEAMERFNREKARSHRERLDLIAKLMALDQIKAEERVAMRKLTERVRKIDAALVEIIMDEDGGGSIRIIAGGAGSLRMSNSDAYPAGAQASTIVFGPAKIARGKKGSEAVEGEGISAISAEQMSKLGERGKASSTPVSREGISAISAEQLPKLGERGKASSTPVLIESIPAIPAEQTSKLGERGKASSTPVFGEGIFAILAEGMSKLGERGKASSTPLLAEGIFAISAEQTSKLGERGKASSTPLLTESIFAISAEQMSKLGERGKASSTPVSRVGIPSISAEQTSKLGERGKASSTPVLIEGISAILAEQTSKLGERGEASSTPGLRGGISASISAISAEQLPKLGEIGKVSSTPVLIEGISAISARQMSKLGEKDKESPTPVGNSQFADEK